MDMVVTYVRNVAIIVIVGKCIINLLPNAKYEPILRITLSMMVLMYILTSLGVISQNTTLPKALDSYEKINIKVPNKTIIRKGVEEYVYKDILSKENVLEVYEINVQVLTDTENLCGRITGINAILHTDSLEDCLYLQRYLAGKYQLDENKIIIEYKGE